MTSDSECFSWESEVSPGIDEYLKPDYYDGILRDYLFSGCSDVDMLSSFLSNNVVSPRVVELGSGTGRATNEIVSHVEFDELVLVDLAEDMIQRTRERFAGTSGLTFRRGDSIDLLPEVGDIDLLVSLWNISHSVHQHMFRLGRERGEIYVGNIFMRFLRDQLRGHAYIMHYDIQSDEQRLINPWRLDLWRVADPSYDASGQSPSKLLLDKVLRLAKAEGLVEYTCSHHVGEAIVYESSDAALEAFMNFHMEGYYSRQHPHRLKVVDSLLRGFEQYRSGDGIGIRPGCFVYEIKRI